jgi:hypothetical protein
MLADIATYFGLGRSIADWAHSLDPIQLLKYCSTLMAAAYGVYATVTDFHEKKDGKQTLTRKGRIGIAFLLFATLLGFTADGAKDYQDKKNAEQAKAEQKAARDQEATTLQTTQAINVQLTKTQNELSQTAATTQSVLDVSRKAADAFNITDGFSLSVDILVPADQYVVSEFGWSVGVSGSYNGYSLTCLGLTKLQSGPASSIRDLIFESSPTLFFYRKGETSRGKELMLDQELPFLRPCDPADPAAEQTMSLFIPKEPESAETMHQNMEILRHPSNVKWSGAYSEFRSYLDFVDARVILNIWGLGHVPGSYRPVNFRVKNIDIATNKGHHILVKNFRPCKFLGDPAFCGTAIVE